MFFEQLDRFGDAPALQQQERCVSYSVLETMVADFAGQLPSAGLIFVHCNNNLETVVAYLAALRRRLPILLLDWQIAESQFNTLQQAYRPIASIKAGKIDWADSGDSNAQPCQTFDPRLALLLSTSGSTGTPKQVCLSRENLHSNAESICQYLPILNTDVAMTTLPFHYSYGLSVVNTHLLIGAKIVLSDAPVTSREFWQLLEQHQVSSFAGVPATYEMLLRLRFTTKELPCLRYLTQAGGKLDEARVRMLAEYANERGKAFYVMYGQTEATARMAYLAPEKVLQKPGFIGQAIPGGQFELRSSADNLVQQGGAGELVYQGSNIMLGYAENAAELTDFVPLTLLRTGDLAIQDRDGDYRITGRIKRIIKPLGKRMSLDDIEKWFKNKGLEAKATGTDNKLLIALVVTDGADGRTSGNNTNIEEQVSLLAKHLQLHPSLIVIEAVSSIPQTSSGKTDYPALMKLLNGTCE